MDAGLFWLSAFEPVVWRGNRQKKAGMLLPGIRPAAVFAGLNTGISLECPAEIKGILVAYQFADLLNLHIRMADEKASGFVHSQAGEIFGQSDTGIFF